MRKLPFLCLAAAFISYPVLAQTSSPPAARATAEQLQNVEGTYGLSNGRILKLIQLDDRLYAELKDWRTELVAVAENVYASRDGRIRVTFKSDASAEGNVVTIGGDTELLERALPEQVRQPHKTLR
jgi:hypothetical protein